jgi:YidC/Oxa1 family membrane protein insertase
MGAVYGAISAILRFWQDAWHLLLRDGSWLGTNWSWVLAIAFLVLTVRVVLFPIFVKQVKSQRAMQALQPKVKALQDKHKGDRETMQKELMELYRAEKANPLLGCLPMFLQVPVFLGLYQVLGHLRPTITSEKSRQLYGWTLSQFDSASHAKLFGAPIAASLRSTAAQLEPLHASATTVKLVAAILIATMIVTTFLTSRQMILKTGWAVDPQQKMVQRLMLYGLPFSLLISGALFPIGVVIYWVTQNLFSLGQQTWVLHRYPPPKQEGTVSK